MTEPKYRMNSEREHAFTALETFDKSTLNAELSISTDETFGKPIVSMSSLGQLGRFGNQIFQYIFLRVCAEKSNALVECPPWIGQTLFGHSDAKISCCLVPAIERREDGNNLFDVMPESIQYIEKLSGKKSFRIGPEALEQEILNVDFWGFFQLPTCLLAPHQNFIRRLFQPVSDLETSLKEGLERLHSRGKTVVGIHIRRGDYITQPQLGFTLVVPAAWYCEYLDKIWHDLEDPVLFLCSDEIDQILPAFEKFSPVRSENLQVELPEQMQDLNLDFYIDFYMLSNCDIALISNSLFSFAACLLNERGKKFIRPHWCFHSKFVEFNPWDSEPLLRLGHRKSVLDAVLVTYKTQGILASMKCLLFYLPINYLKDLAIRLYLGFKVQGFVGVIKSTLSILGCSFVWSK